MSDEPYVIHDTPEFEDSNIRALKTSDPANAETVFNPLFMRILSNIRAVWQKALTKVDKIEGKGLSANDYTNVEKQKLAELGNYDDSSLQESLSTLQTNKADKTEVSAAFSATNANVTANTAAITAIPSTPLTMTVQLTAGGAQALEVKQVRNITISPSDPSGGVNGDLWFKYS